MFQKDVLANLARRQFDLNHSEAVEVHPIEKGGSDRFFYRIRVADRSFILVRYGGQKEENRHYVAAAEFLESIGVRVPHIYYHDPKEGLIWMQDLGEVDLWSFRDAPAEIRMAHFRGALDQAFLLHTRAMAFLPGSSVTLQKEFSAELYRWEQRYFLENCAGRHFGLEQGEWEELAECDELRDFAGELAALPRVLVHRDFQSQNVMVLNGDTYLIDFQGMRPGLAQYDLASLLFDPYTALSPSEREELLGYYLGKLREESDLDESEFRRIYHAAAAQRLMQALGAYGYLGLVCDRPRFLEFIPVALPRLREVLESLDDRRLGKLSRLVSALYTRLIDGVHSR